MNSIKIKFFVSSCQIVLFSCFGSSIQYSIWSINFDEGEQRNSQSLWTENHWWRYSSHVGEYDFFIFRSQMVFGSEINFSVILSQIVMEFISIFAINTDMMLNDFSNISSKTANKIYIFLHKMCHYYNWCNVVVVYKNKL